MAAYVYRHIRKDANVPFYIGIGTSEFERPYQRAFSKLGRNKYWKRIVEKTSYEVEIIFDNISDQEAISKEIEFIKLYGRVNLRTGTLCNLTDGGDGLLNPTPETRAKMRQRRLGVPPANKGKPMLPHVKEALRKGCIGKPSSTKGMKFSDARKKEISERMKGNKHPFFGKPCAESRKRNIGKANKGKPSHNKGKKISPGLAIVWAKIQANKRKPVLQFKDGILIREWESVWQIRQSKNYTHAGVHACLKKKRKFHKGFTWEYKNSQV